MLTSVSTVVVLYVWLLSLLTSLEEMTQRWLKPVYSTETLCNTAEMLVAKLSPSWQSRRRLACRRELCSLLPTLAPHIRPDCSNTEPTKAESVRVCFSCVKPQVGAGDRRNLETFFPEHCFSTPFPYFWSTNGRSLWSACIRRSGVGAPSLLLRRSHLLPSLFALLSVAFSCRPINHTYTYTHRSRHIHTSTHLSATRLCRHLNACILMHGSALAEASHGSCVCTECTEYAYSVKFNVALFREHLLQ